MTQARNTRFYIDKRNKKWLGVCAGIADYTGIDVTVVRIGVVLLTILGSGNPLIAYLIAAWIAPKKPAELYEQKPEEQKFWQQVRTSPRRTRACRSISSAPCRAQSSRSAFPGRPTRSARPSRISSPPITS